MYLLYYYYYCVVFSMTLIITNVIIILWLIVTYCTYIYTYIYMYIVYMCEGIFLFVYDSHVWGDMTYKDCLGWLSTKQKYMKQQWLGCWYFLKWLGWESFEMVAKIGSSSAKMLIGIYRENIPDPEWLPSSIFIPEPKGIWFVSPEREMCAGKLEIYPLVN
jgi:hypothetical protein